MEALQRKTKQKGFSSPTSDHENIVAYGNILRFFTTKWRNRVYPRIWVIFLTPQKYMSELILPHLSKLAGVPAVNYLCYILDRNYKHQDWGETWNILGFIKNHNGFFNIYIHCSPNDRINNIVVWTKDKLSIICHWACCIIWTA